MNSQLEPGSASKAAAPSSSPPLSPSSPKAAPKPEPSAALQPQGFGPQRRWHGSLALAFAPKGGKTRLSHMRHQGPLRVQRPFYPEGECCHLYLLHPPGGLVSGDSLEINVTVDAGAHALLTTPSAGKIYHGDSCSVHQSQRVTLALSGNGICEWLPQETILFDGALGATDLSVELAAESRFIGWELFCLGRPASELPFTQGWFRQQLQIRRDGLPLLLEKQDLQAGSAMAQARWGYQGYPVAGTFVATGFVERPDALIKSIRETIAPPADAQFAVTWRMGVLVGRYLGGNTEHARHCFTELWQQVRLALLGKPATLPRIWMT